LTKYNGPGGDVVIPNNVTSIGEGAFAHCNSLTEITIPDSVTSIDYCAFSGCKSLESITIPDSVELSKDVFKATPLENKFNHDNYSDNYDDDDYDDDYMTIEEWHNSDEYLDQEIEFVDKLVELLEKEYSGCDVFDEPSVQGMMGSDFITITFADGNEQTFEFDYRDECETIFTEGPEEAAKYYFNQIKSEIEG
jgi:hypothetical protein